MKHSFLKYFAFLLLVFPIGQFHAQEPVSPPRVIFAYEQYLAPEVGSYVELFFSFDASSLVHKSNEDGFQARLEVGYIISNSFKAVKADKYEVLGPLMNSDNERQDFADVQQVLLKPGEYTIDIIIKDLHSDADPVKASQKLVVSLDKEKMGMSGLMFEKTITPTSSEGPFVKNGLLMTPWLVPQLPEFLSSIYVFSEVYNSDFELGSNGAYVESHTLLNLDVDSAFASHAVLKRVKTAKANVIVRKVDLTNLPSGRYLYQIELLNRDQKVVASAGKEFYRQSSVPKLVKQLNIVGLADFEALINGVSNRDTLTEYFRCVRPVADQAQQNFIDMNWEKSPSETLKLFLINFWRDKHPEEAYKEWLKYRSLVRKVDKEFGSSVRRGYDTDQGFVYLRYGKPNQITVRENEPSSYPYIIWQYYAHPLQSNAMYVFYDPTLTYRDYVLLYSNVRGEANNPRWRLILQSRNNPDGDLDKQEGEDHWGGRVDEYFTNPR